MLIAKKPRLAAFFGGLLFLVALIGGSVLAVERYEPTQWQAEQEAKNQSEAKAIDILASERVAYYTKILAIFTGVLSGFGFLQIYFLVRADRVTAQALAASTKQAEIANKQYIAANRPKLRVRLIRVDQPVLGEPITVRYEVINVGGTRATIVDNEITIRVDTTLRAHRYDKQPRTITRTRQFSFAEFLRQGEALPAASEIADFDPAWGHSEHGWWNNNLFVIGMIRYTDGNGVLRRTAFYRVATLNVDRFEFMPFSKAEAADHEYED